MATARINGTDIFHVDHGGSGPAVILSHGFLMDHTMFDPQVDELRSTHRVITWDERGFGGTRATGDFSYWDSARDVLGLMDHLGIESAIVGGMSQGGFLSMRVALLAPERVRGLILIDTQAGTEDPANVEGYGQLHAAWVAHGSSAVQDVIAGIILGAGDWQSWFDKWAVLPTEQFTHAFECLMTRDDITDRLGEITAPTLIVHGDADAAIPVSKAEILRDRISGPTELVVISGGTHAANLTHPEPTNSAIRAFVDRLDS